MRARTKRECGGVLIDRSGWRDAPRWVPLALWGLVLGFLAWSALGVS
ncbi:MAG: hypothetical protein H6811_01715 [Phycisphaeraceae bacterium]|nr:hypothetical protein [Phycisphaeraceae bacterium]